MALFLISSDNFVPLDEIPIKQVTQVQTFDYVRFLTNSKLFSQVHKLLKLYLTIPVTTASYLFIPEYQCRRPEMLIKLFFILAPQ